MKSSEGNKIPPEGILLRSMRMRTSIAELVLPAGDPEKLRYAIAYGADAVYLGLPRTSLRTPLNRETFTFSNLPTHLDYCKKHSVKAYLTLNIFAGNRDIDRLKGEIEKLSDMAPDAVILSDPGLFRLVRQAVPHIPIHISTQANTLNYSACAFWQDLGAKRVILAREVPLQDMEEIHAEVPNLEIECFVHGSLCVAYSGRCLISDYLTENVRSSNKGMCQNSCRLEFEIREKNSLNGKYLLEEDERGSYILNSKDLALVGHLHKLKEAGISAFKVEGRTKGIHYLSSVGKVYREALDYIEQYGSPSQEQVILWESELLNGANRGFTEGFLYGRPDSRSIQYETSQSAACSTFVASSSGELRRDGTLKLLGRNKFSLSDSLVWITPEGAKNVKITEAFDENGFKIDIIQPNKAVWVRPPSEFSEDSLQWSIIRKRLSQREEFVPVVA